MTRPSWCTTSAEEQDDRLAQEFIMRSLVGMARSFELRAILRAGKRRLPQGVTVKLVALEPVPPGVETLILPVTAPVGTVAVSCVSETTENAGAFTPRNVTWGVPFQLFPVRAPRGRTAPLGGRTLHMQ